MASPDEQERNIPLILHVKKKRERDTHTHTHTQVYIHTRQLSDFPKAKAIVLKT